MKNKPEENVEKIENLEEKVEKLQKKIKTLNKKIDKNKNQIGGVNSKIDLIEKKIKNKGIKTNNQTKKEPKKNNSCTLEKICNMNKKERKETSNINIYRASIIWQNYNTWSQKIPRGKILKSGKVKKLLQTVSEKEIEWPQVYRAMKKFEELSPENYIYIEDKQNTKAIIRKTNPKTKIKK